MGSKLLVSDVLTTCAIEDRIETFLFTKTSRLSPELVHRHIHLVLGIPALEVKRLDFFILKK
jgi:hypothetical protein